MRVYGDIQSGNCYKVRLLLAYLQEPHEWVHVDILGGETRRPEFLSKNPAGKIPVLELESGHTLFESNAILHFLAEESALLPADPWLRAQVLQWQFFEQYSHEPFIAVARFIAKYLGLPKNREQEYHAKQEGGNRALGIMNEHLGGNRFFVGDLPTIADISLYAYTHVAHEGGFDLKRYPAVEAWITRMEALPNHVTMAQATAVLRPQAAFLA
jgi:glutathione S-transferase